MPRFSPLMWPLSAMLCIASSPVAAQVAASDTLPTIDVRAPAAAMSPSVLGGSPGPLPSAPASVRVFDHQALQEPGVGSLSRLLEADTSVQPNYATAGYHENFSVRGFTLDPASGYRINGLRVPGELLTSVHNKEGLELLRGVGTLDSGALSPGGAINYLTRRPADIWQLNLGTDARGGRLVAGDWGRTGLLDGRLGVRLNLSHEDLRPEAHAARGQRQFGSVALDLQATSTLRLQADVEYGRRAQPAVPGVQLLGGLLAPPELDPRININQQPWTRPTRNNSHFAGLRAQWQIADAMRLTLGASDAVARIDDNLATPSGCNEAPYSYFCADGRYVLYDYHANERRRIRQQDAALQGTHRWGAAAHHWSLGIERVRRDVAQTNLWSTTVYDDAGLAMTGHIAASAWPLPAPEAAPADLPRRTVRQDSLTLSDRVVWRDWQFALGLRQVRTRIASGTDQPTTVNHTLPFAALSWEPARGQTLYAQVARGLDLGSEAPTSAENAGALLPPRVTRQLELGWRARWDGGHSLSLAAFRMQRPWDFTAPEGNSWAGLGAYQRAGEQVHTGIEASGRWQHRDWNVDAAATWLRAQARDSGVPAFDGVQLQNQPRLRTRLTLTHTPGALPGAALWARWQHVGERNARRDGLARVPSYDTLDLGAQWRCTHCVRGANATLALVLRNATNRRYWRDVSEAYSADLLFPGEPRSLAITLTIQGR